MKMFRVAIDMPWRYGENSKQERQNDFGILADVLSDAGLGYLQASEKQGEQEVIATSEQVAAMMTRLPYAHGVPYIKTVTELGNFGGDNYDQLLGMLARIEASAKVLEARADLSTEFMGDHYNPHANSPVPGPILAEFNDLMLCENSCTDAVQGYLDEGWRIVAVCPQAARRPDYILGRYNINNKSSSARRG